MRTPTAAQTHDAPTILDKRRISEHDADYRRLHAQVERILWTGIHAYARALREGPVSGHDKAASAFIAHQTKALQLGYLAGHWEGERDYWHALSARRSPQGHSALSRAHGVEPNVARMRRTLMFYGAASIAKMAREAQAAWRQDQFTAHLAETYRTYQLDATANAAMDAWLHGLTARVALSADVVWTGLQDGYLAAGTVDSANPYAYVWWMLEPSVAQHCGDCPDLASASPYTAPGSGGNELPQTPGDGGTECGGGCKCTLQWGSSVEPGAPSDYAARQAPSAWEQQRAAAIAQAQAGGAPSWQPNAGGGAPSRGPSDWERRRAEAIAQAQGQLPEGMGTRAPATTPMPGGGSTPATPEPWQGIADALQRADAPLPHASEGDLWQSIADALAPGHPLADGEQGQRALTPPPASPGALNDGQKAALELFRKASLEWDRVRGALPPLELFVNPDAAGAAEWQNVDFAGLTPEQLNAYSYYVDALQLWADSSPLDE